MPSSQLTVPPAEQLALSPEIPLSVEPVVLPIAKLLQGIVQGGVTSENATALEKIVGLYERMEEKAAERRFNEAFVKLQSELPVIVASSIIPNRGKYERFEDVMRQISDPLKNNGFTVSFSMVSDDKRVSVTCHLRHIGGHSTSNQFSVRTGKADTETQADCKAATTAKRNALLQSLNIVIRQDAFQDEEQDASLEGDVIEWDKVEHLRWLLKETGSDEKRFLEFAQADKIENIRQANYARVEAALRKKTEKRS